MSREVSSDFVGGSNHSVVLAALKLRYPRVHEPLPAATPDDRRYLKSLWVFEDPDVDGPESPLPPSFSRLMVDQTIIDPHMIKEKITSVLKVLKFREQHVLVQFWSPVAVRKRWLLTTWDQPFGLGVADEELYWHRLKSEQCAIVVDREHIKDLNSPGRVYSQKFPEWSLDVHGQDTRYNVHGYITLPVFESSSDCCVGILEIITSSSYAEFAFEVHEVWRALKNQNLKSPDVFEDPNFGVSGAPNERRQNELDEIFKVLKTVCDIHNLPLAQTWAPSGYCSYVAASSENLGQSCSSFNRSCIGKVCMSTVNLPFYVRDLSVWEFREACRERHLDISQGIVGRSLSSRGTWFCENVTELEEDDYPLVHYARMSQLTSCLAIYLKSPEADAAHVIEFFLPAHSTNETGLRRLMETVKQQIKNSSWMQLYNFSPLKVIGGLSFNWNLDYPSSPVTLLTEKGELPPPESENVENEPSNSAAAETSQSGVPYLEKEIGDFDIHTGKKRKRRKRSDQSSIGLEDITKHFGKTMDDAAAILNVSRSTLKRICRNLGIPRWPYRIGHDKSDSDALMKSDQIDVVVHTSEVALIENGKHSSTHVPHQQEQANFPVVQPEEAIRGKFVETVQNVTVKATYGENTVRFTHRLSDGLEKLKELVATRFQLEIGSFRLKYMDEDGDKILIACENDLMGSSGAFRHPESTTVIKLFVDSIVRQTSYA